MKLMRSGVLRALMLVCLLTTGIGARAWAGSQDFRLKNQLGMTIREVYVSPATHYHWEEDILGEEVLPDDSSIRIHFSPDEDHTFWDLKVVTADGEEHIWYNFNLKAISQITLSTRNGRTYASHD
jgi:hypothetical protein